MQLFIGIIRNSFSVSIPIILLILFRTKLISKYSMKFNQTLYYLIILKLIVIKKIPIYISESLNLEYVLVDNLKLLSNSNSDNTFYINFIFSSWIVGIISIAFYKIYNHIKVCRYITRFEKNVYDRDMIYSLETQKENMNIRKDIKLFKLKDLYTPMIVGIHNIKIIIPDKEYQPRELDFIFRHELIHYKRKDNCTKLILDLITTIYWFNPLVYILNKYYIEHCEFYCDQLVTMNCDVEDIKIYSLLLLDSIKYKNKLRISLYSSQFNIKKSCKLKRRIGIMFNLKKKKKKKGIILGFICSALTLSSLVSIKVDAFDFLDDNKIDIQKNHEANFIKAVGINGLTGYVKKSDLYNESTPQETLEQVLEYMKVKGEGKRIIPLYDESGNRIDEYMID